MSKIDAVVIDHQNALAEYEERLRVFDWFYNYSDYHPYWKRYAEEHDQLIKIAKSHPDFAELYDQAKSDLAPSNFR